MLKKILCYCMLIGAVWAKPVTTRLFEVNVPDAWEERQTQSALYFLYPGKDVDEPEDANIRIAPSSISGGMSMDGLTFMGKSQIERDYPEMTLGASTPTKLGKLDAHRFEYRGVRKGKKSIIIQVFAISGRNAYQIDFIGSEADYNSQRSSFDSLLRSFRAL